MQIAQLSATVAIGAIAATIAWRQWRTAQDKVKLDLFDRRFSVFMDARKLVSEALQLGAFTDLGLANEVIARAKFLFESDVQKELTELHRICIQITMKNSAAFGEMEQWLTKFEKVVQPYMSMGHLRS